MSAADIPASHCKRGNFMKFFRFDSPFWEFFSRVADLVILNVLWLVFSLPIVTIGASTTAMYCVALHLVRGEGSGVVRMFWNSFRLNFRQATLLFFILLIPTVLVCYELLLYLSGAVTQTLWTGVVFCLPAVLLTLISAYIYPLLAQFDNSIRNTLKNACYLAIGNLPVSLIMAALNLLAPILFLCLPEFFMRSCIFWVAIGAALVAAINSLLLRRIFKKYFNLD